MLEHFQVLARTDGDTSCRIFVEPHKRQCAVTISIDRRIVRQGDEKDLSLASWTWGDWHSIEKWEAEAHKLAKHCSPFWRGERAA